MRKNPFIAILLVYIMGLVVCYQAHLFCFSPPNIPTDTAIYQARLTAFPVEKPKTWQCQLRVEKRLHGDSVQPLNLRIQAYLHKDSTQQLQLGDILVFQTTLRNLDSLNNKGDFDYGAYLRQQGYSATAYVLPAHWQVQQHSKELTLTEQALRCREQLLSRLHQRVQDPRRFATLSAMTLGDRAYLDRELKQQFVNAGAMHVLAVSGLHVGILFTLLQLLLWWLGNMPWARVVRTLLVLATVWGYAFLTGFSPSVQRAAIMLTVGQIGWMTYRKQSFYNTVAIAAFFVLLINPWSLFMPGFQLSFAAVLALVAFSDEFNQIWQPKNHLLRFVWGLFLASFAVQLGTFPISIYYFHQFSTYFWLSGLIVVLLAYAIVALALLALLLPVGGILSNGIDSLLNGALEALNSTVGWVDALPMSTIPIQLDTWQTTILLVAILCLYRLLHLRLKQKSKASNHH